MLKSVVGPMNNIKNKLNSEIILIFYLHPNAHLESVWIPLIAENWKHYSKIIFKYVNSGVGPIFNVYFVEKRGLLNKNRAASFLNTYLMFMSYTDILVLGSSTMPLMS